MVYAIKVVSTLISSNTIRFLDEVIICGTWSSSICNSTALSVSCRKMLFSSVNSLCSASTLVRAYSRFDTNSSCQKKSPMISQASVAKSERSLFRSHHWKSQRLFLHFKSNIFNQSDFFWWIFSNFAETFQDSNLTHMKTLLPS